MLQPLLLQQQKLPLLPLSQLSKTAHSSKTTDRVVHSDCPIFMVSQKKMAKHLVESKEMRTFAPAIQKWCP